MAECLADWYKLAQTVYLKTQILEKDVRDYERKLNDLRDELYHLKSEMKVDENSKATTNNNNKLSKNIQKSLIKVCKFSCI